MKTSTKITLGLIITILIYSISVVISKVVKIPFEFIPSTFLNQLSMLAFSGISIIYFQSKGQLIFSIKPIKLRLVFRTILTAIIVFIATSILVSIALKILFGDIPKGPNPFMNYTPLQYFIFISMITPIAEEFLFRGFLLNMLEPIKKQGHSIISVKN